MNYQEFSTKIKTKYPQYRDMDDKDLAQRMVTKYPEYKDVTFDDKPQQDGVPLFQPKKPSMGGGADFPLERVYKQLPIENYPVAGRIQDVLAQAGVGSAQGLTGGMAEEYLQQGGQTFGKPVTRAGKIVRPIATVAGAIAGVPGKAYGLGSKLISQIPKLATKKVIPTALRTAAGTGLAYATETEPGKGYVQAEERGKKLAVGAGTGLVLGAIGGKVRNIWRNAKNIKDPTKLAKKVRGEFGSIKREAGKKFGADLERLTNQFPEQKINISDAVKSLQTEITENPAIRSAINRSPALKEVFDNPEMANYINLRQAQDIINQLKSRLPLSKLAGQNVRPTDIPLFDLIDDIKLAQLDAFPQMAKARAEYGEVIGKYKVIKNKFKGGSLINNLKKNWNDPEVKKIVDSMLPPDMIQEMGGYESASSLLKKLGIIGQGLAWTTGAGIAGYGVYKIIGKGGGGRQ